jgi:hypothetical protein
VIAVLPMCGRFRVIGCSGYLMYGARVAEVHPGATLTPHFRDFLPTWIAMQPWYVGAGRPSLSPVGYFRFEDPAGEVGIETHLVFDGTVIYQVPMTYRGAPIADDVLGATGSLIATAEHSLLGTRWIYDGLFDPVWAYELLRLVATNGVTDLGARRGVGAAEARGYLLTPRELTPDTVTIELKRVLSAGRPANESDVVGLVMGTWYPDWPDATITTGCLAVVREAATPRRRHT